MKTLQAYLTVLIFIHGLFLITACTQEEDLLSSKNTLASSGDLLPEVSHYAGDHINIDHRFALVFEEGEPVGIVPPDPTNALGISGEVFSVKQGHSLGFFETQLVSGTKLFELVNQALVSGVAGPEKVSMKVKLRNGIIKEMHTVRLFRVDEPPKFSSNHVVFLAVAEGKIQGGGVSTLFAKFELGFEPGDIPRFHRGVLLFDPKSGIDISTSANVLSLQNTDSDDDDKQC